MPLALMTLVFCLVLPSLCLAMKPTFESLDHVLIRTHAALIADIGSVEEDEKPQFYRLIRFAVIPIETLFGDEFARQSLDCRYRQDLVLRRGDMIDAPLISGSGIEFDIKSGDRVILLIEAGADESGSCKVLRMEPLERRDAIKQFGATR